ncbi:Glycerol-3-phosphate acyltransferase 5 [Platanthera guangdongensis]|uniref:Glycerol-3-phosphate acyltransferase 5 n=1 Tax=Platanthera guangdongensis TaxID=2320717 RepID=A0ABR2MKS4_9ASPA
MVQPNRSAPRVPPADLQSRAVFHDGRLVRRPDPLAALLLLLWFPSASSSPYSASSSSTSPYSASSSSTSPSPPTSPATPTASPAFASPSVAAPLPLPPPATSSSATTAPPSIPS